VSAVIVITVMVLVAAVVVIVPVVVIIPVVIIVMTVVVIVPVVIIVATMVLSRLRVGVVSGRRFVGHRRRDGVGVRQALVQRLVPLVILITLWLGLMVFRRVTRSATFLIRFPVISTRRARTPFGR